MLWLPKTAVGCVLIVGVFRPGFVSAQLPTNPDPTLDPEAAKIAYMAGGNPTITENAPCPQTCLGGVLWPTLVQIKDFLVTDTNGGGKVITGGSEKAHNPSPTRRGHLEGFKVDLEIAKTNTYLDPLSLFVLSNTLVTSCRSNDGAPQHFSGTLMTFAMEYPVPAGPNSNTPCPMPPGGYPMFASACCHWDILSSYNELDLTPTSMTVKVADTMTVSPVAKDQIGDVITSIPWMFEYVFPQDPGQTIAQIDPTGAITGTPGSVIGISVGTSSLEVSEGPFSGTVVVTVEPPDPPGGGPVCPVGANTTGCWSWQGNSWNWNPPTPTTQNPYPPGPPPPPFGVCPPGSGTTSVPCWQWNPTANNGGGAWVFVPPGGSYTSPPITTPPITPVSSIDPNDISGPPGVGSPMYISGASPTPYTVFFENEPTATAPAQQVVVTDQIDTTRFDLTSVTPGPITFPGISGVNPPPVPLLSLNGYTTQVDLRPSTNLLINVSVSLNPTGLVTWTLQSLDPSTGQPPTDPTVGFLPPGGDGSVSFTARVIPSLTTGTLIADQAIVVFDANPAISTPVWSNTIDDTPPTSHVPSLPPFSILSAFPVQWSGTDVGSGIQDFTVYVSDDGAPFTVFQAHTPTTTATFTGEPGHSYSFYSIARDLVGNVESAKTAMEATTQTGLAFATLTAHAEISKGSHPGFELSGNLTLGPGSVGVAPDTQRVTLAFGSFSATIPAGSFRKNKNGHYSFEGSINGVHIEFSIAPAVGSSFSFHVEADGASLSGTSNPIPLELLIGTNGGTTQVTAEID